MNLGGSLTRQIEQDASVSEASPHIANIGKMVEEMENKIRYIPCVERVRHFRINFFRIIIKNGLIFFKKNSERYL